MQKLRTILAGVCVVASGLLPTVSAQAGISPMTSPSEKTNKIIILRVSGPSYFALGEGYARRLDRQLCQQWARMSKTAYYQHYRPRNHFDASESAFISGESRGSGIPLRAIEAMQQYYSSDNSQGKVEQPLYSFLATRSLSRDHRLLIARSLPVLRERHAPLVVAVLCKTGQRPIAAVNYLGAFDTDTVVDPKGLFVERDQFQQPATEENSQTVQNNNDNTALNRAVTAKVSELPTSQPDYRVNVIEHAHIFTMNEHQKRAFSIQYYGHPQWDEMLWYNQPKKIESLPLQTQHLLDEHFDQETQLANDHNEPRLQKMEQLLSGDWRNGAMMTRVATRYHHAMSDCSCYVVVFDPVAKELAMKNLADRSGWHAISLGSLFNG